MSTEARRPATGGSIGDTLLDLSAENLRQVVASTYELFVISPAEGGVASFSPGWQHTLGWTPEELRGLSIAELIHPEDLLAAQAVLAALRRGEGPCRLENRYRHRDGSYRWLRWTGLYLPDLRCICAFGYETTAQKLAEQALEQNERRLRLAMAATSVAVWELDVGTGALHVSPGWFEMLGYRDGEFQASREAWQRMCHPEDLERILNGIQDVLANPHSKAFEAEFRMRAREGTWRWFLGRGDVTERGPSGEPLLFSGTNTDITERKRVESELRRLAAIVDQTPCFVGTCTTDGQITYMNPSGRNLLGLDARCFEEGLSISTVHPEWAQRIIREEGIPKACSQGVWQAGSAMVDADGAEIPVELSIVAHRDSEGRVEFLSAIMLDVSRQKHAERALRESEQRFRTFFESAPYAVAIHDLEGRYVDVNPHFLESNGARLDQVIGRRPEELPEIFSTDPPEKARERYRRLLETGLVVGEEVDVIRRLDGQRRTVLLTSRLISLGGEPRILSLSADMTELRQMERQVRHAQKMDAIGRLAGGVAHDFNNLLTVIGGYTELALGELDEAHPLRAQLTEVSKAAARAAQLTRQLLAFSRSETIKPDLVDVNAVVADAERMLGRLIGEHIRIETRLESPLSPVLADSALIVQVLMNLVVNARDAMPGGGRVGIATSQAELDNGHARALGLTPGRYVCLQVSDTGTGMDEETLSRIFEPFFTTKPAGQGTGLGLSIAYGIVKQCHGGIGVESQPGAGSRFDIFLPVARPGPVAHPGASSTAIARAVGTVLLVEDDDALRVLATQILSAAGYQVLAAASGPDALDLSHAHASEISLLLTDLTLPGLDGRSVARSVRGFNPSLPIVYMTGYSSSDTTDEEVASECEEFLRKPFTPAELLEALQRAALKRG